MLTPPLEPADQVRPERSPRIRVEFSTLVWRITLIAFMVLEFGLYRRLRRWRPRPRAPFLVVVFLYMTPKRAFLALAIGAVAGVLTDLVVRWVVRPLLRAWYNPRVEADTLAFHLGSNETVESSTPARRAAGRQWRPGILVRTNTRLWFFPNHWSEAPWSAPLGQIVVAERALPPRLGWGVLTGLPDRLALQAPGSDTETFLIADPDEVVSWLHIPQRKRT